MWNKGKFLMLGIAIGMLVGIFASWLDTREAFPAHEAAAFISGEMVGAYGNDPELDIQLCALLPGLDKEIGKLSGFDSDKWIASRMAEIHRSCSEPPENTPSPKMGSDPVARR